MSDSSRHSSSRHSESTESREGSSHLSSSKRRLVPLPSPGSIHDVESRNAIQRHITEGLPRSKRPFDPNRIELFLPPDFLSSPPASAEIVPPGGASSSTSFSENALFQGSARTFGESSPNTDPLPPYESFLEPRRHAPQTTSLNLALSSPVTPLGAGRIDPFANYPIKMNNGELWLIDQVNTERDPVFRTLRERWLPVMIKDPATFHQFLANVSLQVSRIRGEDLDNVVAVAHHSLAIRSVNKKLSDPALKTSDQTITGILSFVCYNLVKGDFDAAVVHLGGLSNVILLRGGYKSITANPILANLIYGVEMTKILKHDAKPIYPMPETLLDIQRQQFGLEFTTLDKGHTTEGPWKHIFPDGHLMIDVFDQLRSATELAHSKATNDQSWKVVNFVLTRMYPIVHRLMGFESEIDLSDYWSIIQEASRLGIFLFLGEIRRQCGALGVSTTLFVAKLKSFISIMGDTIDWRPCHPLLLWILFFGTLESWGLQEQVWFVETVLSIAKSMDIRSWDGIVEAVRNFLWVDNIYDEKVEIIGAHLIAKFA